MDFLRGLETKQRLLEMTTSHQAVEGDLVSLEVNRCILVWLEGSMKDRTKMGLPDCCSGLSS